MAGPPMHFSPAPGWPGPGLDAYRDPYRLDPMHQLRYAPSMIEAYRAQEDERAKALYSAHLRKEPSPIPAPPHRLKNSTSENAPAR